MPTPDSIKYGILRCRDLVELFFAGRMVANLKETFVASIGAAPVTLLGQDPRRISYEIWFAVPDGGTYWSVFAGSNYDAVANAAAPLFSSPPAMWLIKRSFFEDLDAVCLPYYAAVPGGFESPSVIVREVYLTPAPVDEIP